MIIIPYLFKYYEDFPHRFVPSSTPDLNATRRGPNFLEWPRYKIYGMCASTGSPTLLNWNPLYFDIRAATDETG